MEALNSYPKRTLTLAGGGTAAVQAPPPAAEALSGAVAALQQQHRQQLASMQADNDARTGSLADKVMALESELLVSAAVLERAREAEAEAQVCTRACTHMRSHAQRERESE
jgi:hypothetical protein